MFQLQFWTASQFHYIIYVWLSSNKPILKYNSQAIAKLQENEKYLNRATIHINFKSHEVNCNEIISNKILDRFAEKCYKKSNAKHIIPIDCKFIYVLRTVMQRIHGKLHT